MTKDLQKVKKELNWLKRLSLTLLCVVAIFFALVAFFIFVILNDDGKTAPVFFSLHDPKATYTIHKYDVSSTTEHKENYMVSYRSSKDDIEVEVGNSKIELDPYVNKKIVINGSYTGRIGKQCIVEKCTPYTVGAVIDINSIQIVK